MIEQLTINNSLLTTYTYEADRNLKTQVKNQFNAQLISQYDYTYNSLGLRDHMVTSGNAFTGSPIEPTPETSTYTANSLNQYTQIIKDDGQQTTDTLTNDDDGNLTSISSAGSTKIYKYNAENRLVSVEPATPTNNDKKVEFVYDYMGRRVQKKVYSYVSSVYSLQSIHLFFYDGWNLIQELNVSGTVQRAYVWGLDINQSLDGAGGIGGLLSSIQDQESSSQLFLYDANGNVGQLIDSDDGSIEAHYEYDPFGVMLKSYGTMKDENPFRFSTKFFDIETGLGYWGYRYYFPELGRWVNRDPVQEEGGLNLYSFVENDAINFFDSLGQWKVTPESAGKTLRVYLWESGDTKESLAIKVGLDISDFNKWAKPKQPSIAANGKAHCEYSVPNVVIAYWAGDMGKFGKWWVDWNSNINNYKNQGYLVDERNGSSGTSSRDYQDLLQSNGQAGVLYGTYFWGHGNKKGLANSKDPHYLLVFSSLNFSYRIAFAHIYACESNSGKTAFNALKWTGFTGTLYPLNPFDPDWDNPSH